MGYYNYHGMNKRRIENGELVGFVETGKTEPEQHGYVLNFNSPPFCRPIKNKSAHLYFKIFGMEEANE